MRFVSGHGFSHAEKSRKGGRLQPLLMAIPIRHANPKNITAGARTFLVTSSTTDKRNLLQSERSAGLFITVLYDFRAQGVFGLHEFVVMPDHFHILVTVDPGTSIERAVQFVKGGFAYRAGKQFGMRAPIWQKGFSDRRIWGSYDFERVRNYIHNNPVKRLLTHDAAQFPYSSAHRGFKLDPPPLQLNPKVLTPVICAADGMSKKTSRDAVLHSAFR
jgi:putative transposase